MTAYVATVSGDAPGNWDICKAEGLWGVIERGGSATGAANARRVAAGDLIYVWLGRPRSGPGLSGVIARAVVLEHFMPTGPHLQAPWPDPDAYAGVFPIRVLNELDAPVPDSFTAPGQTGVRFGISNMALIHGFRSLDDQTADRLAALFPALPADPTVGVPFADPPPPTPVATGDPFDVDPDAVDRGLRAHHVTVERLAGWVRAQGFWPLQAGPTGPQFDLAWFVGSTLHVAEVKSITAKNEEAQLRLGLGQVLRYESQLKAVATTVQPWLVAETEPTDTTWLTTCADNVVELSWPAQLAGRSMSP